MKLRIYLQALMAFCLILSCSKEEEDPVPEVQKPVNLAPAIPLQLQPAQNENCAPVNVLFRWNESLDPDGDRVFYRLEVSSNENFTNIVRALQFEALEVNMNLEPGNTFFWRVKALDALHNESDYSSVRTFFTEPDPGYNSIPHLPHQISPGNGVTVTDNRVQLEWTAQHPDDDELTYDIYFGTDDSPGLLAEGLEGTTKEVAITPNKTYFWKVIVIDSRGAKSIGNLWYFKS